MRFITNLHLLFNINERDADPMMSSVPSLTKSNNGVLFLEQLLEESGYFMRPGR